MTETRTKLVGFVKLVAHWIQNGPRDRSGLPELLIATALHWRTYAVMFFGLLPLAAGLLILERSSPFWALVVATMVANTTATSVLRVSPKYNISKNY